MYEYKSLDESRLMKRLSGRADSDNQSLTAEVHSAAIRAADLLSTVVVDMPLYTFHNERHVLNVLGWMEALLGDSIENLSSLECAVSILAAYTHDLGMTLSAAERDALESDPDYLRFRDAYVEERHLIDTLRASGAHYRAALIENHLRTEYIRTTHADRLGKRLVERLKVVAPNCVFRGFDYRRHLELVAVSHNHPAEWLRIQCAKEHLSLRETVGKNEPANFGRVGILLRLADLMDFDSSRTPLILFRHIGLDRDLGTRFEDTSSKEWKKHLAVTGIDWPPGTDTLTYRAANCPHPAIEKSVRDFVQLIQSEVGQAASETRHLEDDDRFQVRLPDVRADVRPAWVNGSPVYTFHDWSFRLDQAEIIQLLMGESLYGDPSLCIRELLQNALDALELRELRLKMRASGVAPAEPVDGEWVSPGQFVHDGLQEPLAVNLTWGEDAGHQFVRVEDNGTGMTESVIQGYFTQIGRSFYRSADYRGEQAAMRSVGLIATPISKFGIGVLSCFMIADRIVVRTHPGQASEGRQALDLEISGPGSLFWTRQGTRSRQGTEITLWLRKGSGNKPLSLQPKREEGFERLRRIFGYGHGPVRSDVMDPGVIAAQHVVWPRYPIRVVPPNGEGYVIDERLHFDLLSKIDGKQLGRRAADWGYIPSSVKSARWEVFDWADVDGDSATGSRVRLWYPRVDKADNPPSFWELATLVSPQVGGAVPRLLVQGMAVADVRALYPEIPLFPGPGHRIWIDLRGTASPSLTADRKKASVPKDQPEWSSVIVDLFARLARHVAEHAVERSQVFLWNVWLRDCAAPLRQSLPRSLNQAQLPDCSASGRLAVASLTLEAEAQRVRFNEIYFYSEDAATGLYEVVRGLTRDRALESVIDRTTKPSRSRTRSRSSALSTLLASDSEFLRDVAIALARGMASVDARTFPFDLESRIGKGVEAFALPLSALQSNWLQEAYFPSLRHSWPGAELQGIDGNIGDALLIAPAAFRFDLQDGRVLFSDPGGREPSKLAELGYDICFPMTAIPLGDLRRGCGPWRQDRRYRAAGVLPFLVPRSANVMKEHSGRLVDLYSSKTIYAFWPSETLWYKPFSDWSEADWQHPGHLSLLWSLAEAKLWVTAGACWRKEADSPGNLVDVSVGK